MATLTDAEIAVLKELCQDTGLSAPERPALRRTGLGARDAAAGIHGFRGGPWKVAYADANGVVQEVALGADDTVFRSTGAASAPAFETIGMAYKTVTPGYFCYPTGPSVGTTVTANAAADTYGNYAELTSGTAAAVYLVGIVLRTTGTPTYTQYDIATGAAASETVVSTGKLIPLVSAGSTRGEVYFPFPIPVAISTRIAVRVADSVGATNYDCTLLVIAQASLTPI